MNISTISSYVPNVSNYIPKIRLASKEQAVKNITKIAVPVIALVALANVATASATPFTNCMEACDRIEHDSLKLICNIGCAIFTDNK